MAAWSIMIGSAFVVVLAYDQIASLHTVAWRDSIEETLAGGSFGLSVDDVRSVTRAAALVAGACAAAAAILGWHVLRRSKSSRLGLTILAAPLFVAGLFSGGFLAAVVVAAIVMLWVPPSSYWFEGRAAPQVPKLPTVLRPNEIPPPPGAPGAPAAVRPSAPTGYRPPAGFEPAGTAPLSIPAAEFGPGQVPAPPGQAQARPVALQVAIALMGLMTALVPIGQVATHTVGDGATSFGFAVVVLLWSVGCGAVSFATWLRRRVGWTVLSVMAGVNVVASLLLGIAWLDAGDSAAASVQVALVLANGAVLSLLQRRDVVGWIRGV
ncbi:hypothetical protein BH09ACT11_BH09ACT11_08790 [soil metagenome]